MNVEQGTDIPEAVLSGRLDIGVLAHTTEGEGEITECVGVATLPLTAARSRLHFFIGPRSSLAGRESISIQDLRGQTIIVPLIPECTNIRGDLTCLCEARGFTSQFMATTLSSIDDLFCMDLGAGLLIGISEYFDRGFANSGISMACCTDEVYVTSYLLYPSQGDDTGRRFIEAVRTANATANSR